MQTEYSYRDDGDLSSLVTVTDHGQVLLNFDYAYDPVGNLLKETGDVPNRLTYTGQIYDGAAIQYYLRARFYNPAIGRFIQEDVYQGDGLKLYAYCHNNPVVYFDPGGCAENCHQEQTGGDGGLQNGERDTTMLSDDATVVRGGLSEPQNLIGNQAGVSGRADRAVRKCEGSCPVYRAD